MVRDIGKRLVCMYQIGKFRFGLRWYLSARMSSLMDALSSTFFFLRSLVQIKSHAQKVLKRINSGENVFRRLEENVSRLHVLVTQIHSQMNLEPPTVLLQPTTFLSYSNLGDLGTGNTGSVIVAASELKHKAAVEANDDDEADATQRKRPRNNNDNKPTKNGTEHIAASALCQLAGPEDEENEDGTEKIKESVLPGDGGIKADDDIDLGELISI